MVSSQVKTVSPAHPEDHGPQYELRVSTKGLASRLLEVWQLPTAASPHLTSAKRIAGLQGRNLDLVEHRLLRKLKRSGIDWSVDKTAKSLRFLLNEDEALHLGLIFRVLAPMRSRNNMVSCAEGIDAMAKEEASYWLGMAMHRKYPRRVLMALRFLLIDPKA